MRTLQESQLPKFTRGQNNVTERFLNFLDEVDTKFAFFKKLTTQKIESLCKNIRVYKQKYPPFIDSL